MIVNQMTTSKVSGQLFNSNGEAVQSQQVIAVDVDLIGAAIYKTVTTISLFLPSNRLQ